MSEFDLLDLIIVAAFAFYCGYKYHQHVIIHEMADMIEDMMDKIEAGPLAKDEETGELLSGPMHELKHEFENDTHYFYFEKDGVFAAQGRTLEDAALHFKETVKGEGMGFFKLSTADESYAFVDGKVHDAAVGRIKL